MIVVGPASPSARSQVPRTSVGPARDPSATLDRRIRAESVLWLTTVSSGGRPHIVPIWFRWDGRTFLLFTKPEARKARNIRSNPAVMLALGDPTADFDVLLVEGVADVLELPASDVVPESFFHEYAERMANVGLSRDDFLATYSLAIRVRPTRYLGWAGRSHLAERGQESTLPPWVGPPAPAGIRRPPGARDATGRDPADAHRAAHSPAAEEIVKDIEGVEP